MANKTKKQKKNKNKNKNKNKKPENANTTNDELKNVVAEEEMTDKVETIGIKNKMSKKLSKENDMFARENDMFARWELEVDRLHRYYLSIDGDNNTLGDDIDPQEEKRLVKLLINHNIDVLETVHNPVDKKPQFEIVCQAIGRVFNPAPIKDLTLVSAYASEIEKYGGVGKCKGEKYYNSEEMHRLLEADSAKGGVPFVWPDRVGVDAPSSSPSSTEKEIQEVAGKLENIKIFN